MIDDYIESQQPDTENRRLRRTERRQAQAIMNIDLEEVGLTRESIFSSVMESRQKQIERDGNQNLKAEELSELYGPAPSSPADLHPEIVSAFVSRAKEIQEFQSQKFTFKDVIVSCPFSHLDLKFLSIVLFFFGLLLLLLLLSKSSF